MEHGKTIDDEEMSSVLLLGLTNDFHVIASQLEDADQSNFDYIATKITRYAIKNKLQNKFSKKISGNNTGEDVAYNVCGHFLKGKCKYGEKCYKEHPERGANKADAKDSKNKEDAKDKKAVDKNKKDDEGLTCFRCNKKGHIAKNCRVKIKGVAAPVLGEDGESNESSDETH